MTERYKRLVSSIDYYYCIDTTNDNKGLTEEDMLNLLNKQYEQIKELEKENRGLQFKIIDMLDFVKEKGTVTREEIKKWWNGGMTEKPYYYDRALDKIKNRETGDDYWFLCDIADLLNKQDKRIKELEKEKEFWKGDSCNCSNYLSILSMDCQIVQEAICDLKNVIDVDTEAFRLLDELDDKFDELNQHRIKMYSR